MRIAIPVANGKLAAHFGHCQHFALIDVDDESKNVGKSSLVEAPDHSPGLLPRWLAERQVNLVISGGMGMRAQELFKASGIDVKVGAPVDSPENLVASYINDSLVTGDNLCDH